LFVDRVDRRLVSCLNFLLQAVAMAILMTTSAPALLVIGCVLFGLGLGNLVSLPALIVQQEFPAPHFAHVVSMVVAINQLAFAFGRRCWAACSSRTALTAAHCLPASSCR
jgi:predicted MFS family arabinose efflux permease